MAKSITQLSDQLGILPRFFNNLHFGSRPILSIKLNPSEEKTLLYLSREEGCPMNDYANKLGLEKGSFTAIADNLEKKGLIQREIVSGDKRKCALVLTSYGKGIAEEVHAFFMKRMEEKLSVLSDEDLIELERSLETIATTYEKIQKRGN
jgi:DNA-binding MarR family transcriptional regulator